MNAVEMMFSPRGPSPSTPKRRRFVQAGYSPAVGTASKAMAGPRFSTPVRKKQGPAPSPSAMLAGMGSKLFPGMHSFPTSPLYVMWCGCGVGAGGGSRHGRVKGVDSAHPPRTTRARGEHYSSTLSSRRLEGVISSLRDI